MSHHLFGWGSASDGQLGETPCDVLTPRPIPGLPPAASIIDFVPGLWSSLILTPNAVLSTRPMGHKPLPLAPLPLTSVNLPSFVAAGKGRDFALLLTACGSLYSVGTGAFGELGLGGQTSAAIPTQIHNLTKIKIISIAAAEFHWLALDATGNVFSCGNNASGQLGLGHSHPVSSPILVTALWPHPIVAISTGDSHSAALSANGSLFCFGSNKYGQLGNSCNRIRVASLTPALVPSPFSKSTVSGTSHNRGDSMEIDNFSIGGPSCLGDACRQFFEGTNPSLFYVDVACGGAHTVALRSDGSLFCWGKGENGQLGTRSTRTLYEPTEVRILDSFVSVSAGERHSAAVTEDGRAFLWGDGSAGQIGDGEACDKYLPVELPSPRISDLNSRLRFLRVRCGGFHTLASVGTPSVSVYNASKAYELRVPRCVVDTMLQPKAGLSRFGCAKVLLRTFLQRNQNHEICTSVQELDYIGAQTAHVKFLRIFGDPGRQILRIAAARIRRQAQMAFGLIKNEVPDALEGSEFLSETTLVAPKSLFAKDDIHFRSSVANYAECGYLFFIALMNPIYGEIGCVPELAELAAIVTRCEESGREVFLETVSYCEEDVLVNRLIHPFQMALTDELKGYRRITRNAIFATRMLAMCYHGVWRRSKRKNARSLGALRELFCNETVSEMVNFAEDYERWKQGKEQYHLPDEDSSKCKPDINNFEYSAMELLNLPPLPAAGTEEGPFAFCSYSFLLTEEAKFKILQIESTMTMNKESMRSLLSFGAAQVSVGRVAELRVPAEQMAHLQFLVLYVRRNNIVSDAYGQVADYARNQPRALRKPLKVIFNGEEGIDEGGVSKEFYQVLMEQILSPDYGMFEHDNECHIHWFRKDFLEPEGSWQLIGLMFGLAAFNSILLDVQFPPVVYRKLAVAVRNAHTGKNEAFGCSGLKEGFKYKADLGDVLETFPSIGASLKHLRDYSGDDVENAFGLNFEISYQGLFGKVEDIELIENGSQIPVTNRNRNKFITLYTDFLINKSIEKAFNPFAAGFVFMLNGPFVNVLTADDLETLVVGEKDLNFSGLRQAARYEGYDERSTIVRNLWQVLDEYNDLMKKLFLAFVTGTDRAPIGGLQKLKLVIQREGPDSNRLPTSRTCFNILLMPDYSTRAKLRDRLTTAIRNSKGFGLQ